MTRFDALHRAASWLHEQLPCLPAETINDLVEHPHAAAPDEQAYARVTGLPHELVHTLWKEAA